MQLPFDKSYNRISPTFLCASPLCKQAQNPHWNIQCGCIIESRKILISWFIPFCMVVCDDVSIMQNRCPRTILVVSFSTVEWESGSFFTNLLCTWKVQSPQKPHAVHFPKWSPSFQGHLKLRGERPAQSTVGGVQQWTTKRQEHCILKFSNAHMDKITTWLSNVVEVRIAVM